MLSSDTLVCWRFNVKLPSKTALRDNSRFALCETEHAKRFLLFGQHFDNNKIKPRHTAKVHFIGTYRLPIKTTVQMVGASFTTDYRNNINSLLKSDESFWNSLSYTWRWRLDALPSEDGIRNVVIFEFPNFFFRAFRHDRRRKIASRAFEKSRPPAIATNNILVRHRRINVIFVGFRYRY